MSRKKASTSPKDRARVLEENRQAKMAESAHRYVRGNTRQFYQWLESTSGKQIPQGPPVWICGDCHVGNIGPLADLKGSVEIQIRDLDQTVIGNPAHDLVRLALSLATSARGSDLPGVTLVEMLEQIVEGYERGLVTPHQVRKVRGDDELAPIRSVLDRSKRRRWHHLATERIKDVTPHIPLGERFWTLDATEPKEIAELFANDAVVAKVRTAKGRDHRTKVAVVDAAYWMKGCSSLGRLRYAVLLELRKKEARDYCLIDLKEATVAAAPHANRRRDLDDAHRVVEGACNISPNLGQRMMAVHLINKPVVLRELMPQDLKFDLDSAHPGRSRRCGWLPCRGGCKSPRQADGSEDPFRLAFRVTQATLQKPRCPELAVDKRRSAHRRPRSRISRALPKVRILSIETTLHDCRVDSSSFTILGSVLIPHALLGHHPILHMWVEIASNPLGFTLGALQAQFEQVTIPQ